MQHPSPRVISNEPQGSRAFCHDGDSVSADGISLALYQRGVEFSVVARILRGPVHNLEMVSVLVAFEMLVRRDDKDQVKWRLAMDVLCCQHS
jgi:hypothetical protein